MTDREPDETTDSDDETAGGEQTTLETLTREDEWGEEAFRDAGEATFGSQ